MASDFETADGHGPARANALIDRICGLAGKTPPPFGMCWNQSTPVTFARIIIGMFPTWFDFGEDKFGILVWRRGLHLIVSGETSTLLRITTSDSRCMACCLVGESIHEARIDMHYRPFPDQAAHAKVVIGLAVHALFPERGPAPLPAGVVVPPGKVFPTGWNGEIVNEVATSGKTVAGTGKQWWKLW